MNTWKCFLSVIVTFAMLTTSTAPAFAAQDTDAEIQAARRHLDQLRAQKAAEERRRQEAARRPIGAPSMRRNPLAAKSAMWDFALASVSIVTGVIGLVQLDSAKRDRAAAKRQREEDNSNFRFHHFESGKFWGYYIDDLANHGGVNASVDLEAYDFHWGQAEYYTGQASKQAKIMDKAEYHAALWEGIASVTFALGAVLLVKGLVVVAAANKYTGQLAGTPLRLAAAVYPEPRLTLAYDF